MEQRKEEITRRPLYVYDLPLDILDTLARKDDATEGPSQDSFAQISQRPNKFPQSDTENAVGSKACSLCTTNFATVEEQRSHVRSDLHGYNLKQRIRGAKPVTEVEFEKLVGDLDESLSGSDSSATSDDDEADRKESTLSALLKKQAAITATQNNEETPDTSKRKRGSGGPPLIWLTTPLLPRNTYLGIYRALFTPAELARESGFISILRQKQCPLEAPSKASNNGENGIPKPAASKDPHFFLCMLGGGHFAGMIVSLSLRHSKSTSVGPLTNTINILASKTFQRYTTRRKQGGSQSTSDSAKGAAHSAGSSLRRYNETALTEEVRGLLKEWKAWIDIAELCFVRASGTNNRRTLFGPYEGQVLSQKDGRVRSWPFGTRRATQSELLRAFVELTRVKVITVDPSATPQQEAPAPAKSKKPEKVKETLTEEQQTALLHTHQLTTSIRRSKLPALFNYLSTNSLSPNFEFYPPTAPQNHHTPTPLHLAASLGNILILKGLLEHGADLSHRNPDDKTAYDISSHRAREWFRVLRHELTSTHPSIPWDAIGVSSPLPRSDLEALERQEALEEKEQEEARRKEEVSKLQELGKEPAGEEIGRGKRQEAGRQKVLGLMNGGGNGSGRALGMGMGMGRTAEETRKEEMRGMSEEARRRVERERRARAAEARFARG